MRGVCWLFVCSLGLLVLCGCKPSFFETREPWRHEAEEQCLKSGAVKEGAAVALLRPIDGPGICGADFPLRVAALGEGSALGYADELRPPGTIPQAGPAYPAQSSPRPPAPSPVYSAPYGDAARPYPQPSAPVELGPPGSGGADDEAIEDDAVPPLDRAPSYGRPSPASRGPQPSSHGAYDPRQERYSPTPDALPPVMTSPRYSPVPLGPARGPALTQAKAAVTPAATLACPIVSALDRWVADAVQPSAARWFGQPVVEIRQISAYSCRGMNGQLGAHISEHAFGNALDVAGFTLADGRKISVRDGWHGSPEEQGFLRDVQAAACEQFTTVLAPGSNRFHYDHIHVDLMRRASGRRICEPGAVSGEEVAARARARYAAPGAPRYTGALSYAPAGARRGDPRDDEDEARD